MSIVDNKKAFFDYFIEERFEAGLVLEGWEVKAIRAGRVQAEDCYIPLGPAANLVLVSEAQIEAGALALLEAK